MTSSDQVRLSPHESELLAGEAGPAQALAMRVIIALAGAVRAPRLQEIEGAHVDGCLYNGEVSLDFSKRLRDLGGSVSVPTTLNVGSLDLLHPGIVRQNDDTDRARQVMDNYRALGCTATWTCAPYQLPARPSFGQHVAWAESNAIAFVNSVLGARTARYGDFIDICAALTGRAPYTGLHVDANRLATVHFDCRDLPAGRLDDEAGWSVLGVLVGSLSGSEVPVLEGLQHDPGEDDLKAFASAGASAGGIAMFHIVGVTPEASTLAECAAPNRDLRRVSVDDAAWVSARERLSTARATEVDAISVGTPHFSFGEFGRLAALLAARADEPVHRPFYVSTGRDTLARARAAGYAAVCEARGLTLVTDTCTYLAPIISARARVVMTNSGKWAWYAPANLGVDVVFASLRECVAAAFEERPGQRQQSAS